MEFYEIKTVKQMFPTLKSLRHTYRTSTNAHFSFHPHPPQSYPLYTSQLHLLCATDKVNPRAKSAAVRHFPDALARAHSIFRTLPFRAARKYLTTSRLC